MMGEVCKNNGLHVKKRKRCSTSVMGSLGREGGGRGKNYDHKARGAARKTNTGQKHQKTSQLRLSPSGNASAAKLSEPLKKRRGKKKENKYAEGDG